MFGHLTAAAVLTGLRHVTDIHTDREGVHISVGPFGGTLRWDRLEKEVIEHIPTSLWSRALPVVREVGRRFTTYRAPGEVLGGIPDPGPETYRTTTPRIAPAPAPDN